MQKSIEIWGEKIPYNTGESKEPDMILQKKNNIVAMFQWIKDIFGKEVMKDTRRLDTFTWIDEIETGKTSKLYDDIPTIAPILSTESDLAVIIAPGGGFCNKSRKREGYDVARYLAGKGISAFVLDYRLNPYKAPVCYLDMQRAIRYVRFHAAEYGVNPGRIGAMGFSAGGYIAGGAEVLLGNTPVNYPGYEPDEIDEIDGHANFLGMIYPVVSFERNPNMLGLLTGEAFFDERKRVNLMKQYSLSEQLTADMRQPQFLCYGTKDILKGMDEYNSKLEMLRIPHKTLLLKGANHGFALGGRKYGYWVDEYVKWIRELFVL